MDKIQKLKYILILIFVLTITTTFAVKKGVYNMQKEVLVIDNKINDLEQEKYMLKIEWSYLTSPERLIEISKKMDKNISDENKPVMISAKQVKRLENLIPYYYAKSKEDNNVNPIASNLEF